jgi:APA family basic amino acid/polyamine antiporter
MPETGGQYVFFQRMYGQFFAYLYGWAAFAVINTAGIASIAYVMTTYLEYFIQLPRCSVEVENSIDLYLPFIGHLFPLENLGVKSVTVCILILLTIVSYRSTKAGGRLLVIFTAMKMLAIGLVVMAIFMSGNGSAANFVQDSTSIQSDGWALMGAIMAATSGAFWAYDGWINITSVAGEIKDPQRNIPKSLFLGTTFCIAIYVVINLAFLYVLPVDRMADSPMVAADAARVVLGSLGGGLIALLVIVSTLGSTHSNILSTARITYAMAAQGRFIKSIGEVHPRFGTPGNALLLHVVWASVLVFSGSFDALTDMLIFVSWLFYGMSALGLFVLRRKMPDAVRPYKVWGYPYVPAVFVAFTTFYLGMTLYIDVTNYMEGKTVFINSVMGIFLTCLGIPLYWYFKKNNK